MIATASGNAPPGADYCRWQPAAGVFAMADALAAERVAWWLAFRRDSQSGTTATFEAEEAGGNALGALTCAFQIGRAHV